ncbi:MAG: MFS transporter [Ardenticatenaceae bacterium]|nr:MFS transporter [Ardenticatenaceae bacterium]MCB9004112.1 MFS transporter [Ardenticatenaceae bacterium]
MTQEQTPYKKSVKPFLIIWSGQAVSLLGSQLVQFALIWWLTQTTGSATVLATASLVGLVPQVVLGPFAGVLVDRWNRKIAMLAADGVVALATLLLAYLFWIDVAQIWHVFLILFVRSLGGAFHWPAMQSSTTLMVPEEQLTRMQGLNQTIQGGLNIASAPLGALLLTVLPLQGILFIDVITALFAIVPLLFVFVPQPLRKTAVSQTTFWSDMKEGLRYAWSWPGLLLLMLLAMMINLVLTPAFSLLPLLVSQELQGGAIQLGWIEAAFGVGIVVGGLLLSVWGGFKRRVFTSLIGLFGMGGAALLLGSTPTGIFALAIGAALVIGAMQSLVNGPILAIFQATIAPEMQGRVFTLIGSLASGMSPIGLLIAGPIADALGVRTWYIVGGLVTIIMGVIGFFIPAVRNVEDGPNQSEQAAGVELESIVDMETAAEPI